MKCLECGDGRAKHNDPRRPPLDDRCCLCEDCYPGVILDDLEEKTEEFTECINRAYAAMGTKYLNDFLVPFKKYLMMKGLL